MAKIEKSFLTPKWLKVKEMYENETNGSDKEGAWGRLIDVYGRD
jgi:hypothetical protein